MNKHKGNIRQQKVVIDRTEQLLRIIVLFIVLLFPLFSKAQELSNPFQTLREKKEFICGIDNRRTHIHQQQTVIYGLYMGIDFGKKLRFKTGISATLFEKGKLIDEQGILKRNKLVFVNLGEEFDFMMINKFRFTTYFQAGIGHNFFRKIDTSLIEIQKGRDLIIPIEAGLHANYDILPWARVKAGGGWRFVLPAYSYDLSGYYIKIGISINSRKLLDACQNNRNEKTTNR